MHEGKDIPPEYLSILLSMVVAALRVIYDRQETKPLRIILESLLCGSLTLTIYHAVLAMNMDPNWGVFAGGVIGCFGSTAVKTFAYRVVNKRVNDE